MPSQCLIFVCQDYVIGFVHLYMFCSLLHIYKMLFCPHSSQYKSDFSNWTVLAISVSDEDDLPARFSAYEYSALVREDAAVVRVV